MKGCNSCMVARVCMKIEGQDSEDDCEMGCAHTQGKELTSDKWLTDDELFITK